MNAQLSVHNPDEIVFTATFTMPLKEWRALFDQLEIAKWPATDFRASIRSMISQAERTYYPEVVEK